jgi:ElaB protein
MGCQAIVAAYLRSERFICESSQETAVEGSTRDFNSEMRAGRGKAQQAAAAANSEVQNLIADVEDLIQQVGEAADPEVRRLRSKVASAVTSAKRSLASGAEQVQQQARDALEASDRYVRTQPWEAIGIAALAGIAVGFLVSASRR